MMPRPRSRKRPISPTPIDELAAEVAQVVSEGPPPVAILTGMREWMMVRRQVDTRGHIQFWPGGEETFCNVPVIIDRRCSDPKVVATQGELEDILLGGSQ